MKSVGRGGDVVELRKSGACCHELAPNALKASILKLINKRHAFAAGRVGIGFQQGSSHILAIA